MSNPLPPGVAIAITVSPPATDGEHRPLIGVALFSVEEHAPGDFLYQLQIRMITANTSEAALVDWMIPRLPSGRVTIGWQLAETIVPTLLQAGIAATPTAANDLVDALAAMVSIDAVDLADHHGGVAAPPFETVCAGNGIPAAAAGGDGRFNRPDLIREIDLTAVLATNVVAAWRLWARSHHPADPVPHQFAADVLAQWRLDDEAISIWRHDDPQ